jgi:DNA modification methylase
MLLVRQVTGISWTTLKKQEQKLKIDLHKMIIHGDCLEKLKELEDNSVDTVITDPPYGLSFMGKKWDDDVPSIEIWQECLRVLKPGGTALIFAGSRTQHRMACNVEDAGFILKDTIMWLYGSGFPKATDISKQLDKRNGRYFDERFKEYCNEKRKEKVYTLKKVNELMESALTGGGFASCVMGDKKTNELPTLGMYIKLKEVLDLDDRFDELIKRGEAEREIIAQKKQRANSENSNIKMNASVGDLEDITQPSTPEAKLWNGWKSHGLKPAYEPILVAQKPNDGTYANNALKHKVAGLNIDGARIKPEQKGAYKNCDSCGKEKYVKKCFLDKYKNHFCNAECRQEFQKNRNKHICNICENEFEAPKSQGDRSTCSEKCKGVWVSYLQAESNGLNNLEKRGSEILRELGVEFEEQSLIEKKFLVDVYIPKDKLVIQWDGEYWHSKPKRKALDKSQDSYMKKCGYKVLRFTDKEIYSDPECVKEEIKNATTQGRFPANIILDEEVAKDEEWKRYFYTAKASKSERNAGCEGLEEKVGGGMAVTQDKTLKTGSGNERNNLMRNSHPTVKPLKLMEYLCTLTKTPTGGIVLDPFMGSGTTGVACKNTGRQFIGIEREEDYIKIAEARINI